MLFTNSRRRRKTAVSARGKIEKLYQRRKNVARNVPSISKAEAGKGVEAATTVGHVIQPDLDSIYSALDKPRKTIRLVKIFSTDPEIKCELEVVSLKDSPVFSALSYVWGDPTISIGVSKILIPSPAKI
ncbi:hypothetical protein BCR34DRAFT_578078 [Clohesyomyces aquaticus]|uniref:Heterokaryon incompatibility domain-containing protein n=1 Tax=Clohesyomyces aquaticus TaxID=1231657 RepID=A0A1Y1YGX0_9PLEO|nr:hypothetical protein BCR34DRAFT_578078 [Clohesyomyces aquaticus]